MEISSDSAMPPKHPWFVTQNLEDEGNLILYNIDEPMSHYRCHIPEFVGKRIRGCFYICWVLLSSNHTHDVIWSLWNPITSKIINLPRLDEVDISFCCLSAPPDDPNSVLLLKTVGKPSIFYCRLAPNAIWIESTYSDQIKMIYGRDGSLHSLTCCNGKVYAYIKFLNKYSDPSIHIVEVSIEVNNDCKSNQLREEAGGITLLPVLEFFPLDRMNDCTTLLTVLKGCFTELYIIDIGFKDDSKTVAAVNLYKLDKNNMTWEEVEDLKDTVLYVKSPDGDSLPAFYSHTVATSAGSGGGYIHILTNKGSVIYSYHVKDKTLSLASIPSVEGTNHVSAWAIMNDCTTRLEGDHRLNVDYKQEKKAESSFPNGVMKMKEFCIAFECLKLSALPYVVGYECRLKTYNADSKLKQKDDKDVDIVARSSEGDGDESHIFKLPPHVFEMLIMESCIGVEYLKFRATCKHCHLAAPLMTWKTSMRLQNDSLLSPWLIVFHKHKGVITLTDPIFGDKYFIKTPQQLVCGFQIKCSRYGWLLILKSTSRESLVFFNPFTSDILKLPPSPAEIYSFSAPPTSPDCMVVGLAGGLIMPYHLCIHFVGREPCWRRLNFDVSVVKTYQSVAFREQDLYVLRDDGGLDVIQNIGRLDCYILRFEAPAPTTSCCTSFPQCFQVICDQHILRVVVGKFGESVEVFKMKSEEGTIKWVKVDSLGKHMIFINGMSSLCLDAKTPQMENKIYFPRIPIVYYSLETCRFYTFNNENIQDNFGDFFKTKHYLTPHGWIQPRWS